MFTDPQTIHPADADINLPRVAVGNYSGTFTSPSGEWKLSISHQNRKNGAESSLVRIDRQTTAGDAFTSKPIRVTQTAYLVVQRPMNAVGVTQYSDPSEPLKALLTWLAVPANQTKFLGLEA